ncbi:MAG: enoyl-CoA hydratase/isomerase family protein [Vicinamibacterales bacterium]
MSEVLVTDHEAVRVLRLNRPEKLNALDRATSRALLAALRDADADDRVRCVVLTGEGRAFCAGADLKEFEALVPGHDALVRERAQLTTDLHAAFPALNTPTVAAVNGLALGGGAGLALACDMVVMADTATLGYPEVTHGIAPALVMANLVRVAGRKLAFELVATARVLTAHESLAFGLVNHVVALDLVVSSALALATRLAAVSPTAMAATKTLFYEACDVPFADALQAGRRVNEAMRGWRR